MTSSGSIAQFEPSLRSGSHRVLNSFAPKTLRTTRLSYVPQGTTVDTNFWTVTTTGSGNSVTQANGELSVTHGGAGNSMVRIVSPLIPYVPGCVHHFQAELLLDFVGLSMGYNTEVGVCTANVAEKLAFYYDTSGIGKVTHIETAAPQVLTAFSGGLGITNWNGDVTASSLTVPSGVIYQPYDIFWFNNRILYMINYRLMHQLYMPTSVLTKATALGMFFTTVNPNLSSNGTDRIMRIAGCSLSRYGKFNGRTEMRCQRLSTAATTVISRTSGRLESLTLNRPGSASSGTLTLYDNTAGSGTIITVLNTSSSGRARTYKFGLGYMNGLTAVLTGTGTPGDVTLEYS